MPAVPHLWRFLLDPAAGRMTSADAERLHSAMTRLALLTSPATADWLLAPVLPAGVAAISEDEVRGDRLTTRYLRAAAQHWLALIAEAGIAVLPLKGFATGLAIYPEPELRGLGDVDLLLRRADLARLVVLLRDAGFVFRPSQGTARWGHAGDASFDPCVAPDGPLAFDLHIHPDDYPLHRMLPTEAVFAAAQPAMEAGQGLRLPCDAHLLAMAMSHAARDKYDPNALRSLIDVAVMLTRGPRAIDWDAVLAVTSASGVARLAAQVLIGLGLPPDRVPRPLAAPYRGLAAWELSRLLEDLRSLFVAPPGKLALQRREWLLSAGPAVAAWRTARRLRGLWRPWPGRPEV
jgi:hypothetical protein